MAATQERYARLFSPITVGGKELANRLIMAPLYTGYATMEGRLTPYLIEHYRMMGASGLAMVVVESVAVTAADMGSLRTIRGIAVAGNTALPIFPLPLERERVRV